MVTDGGWRLAFASVRGTSHLESGAPCQDASECSVIADGAGQPVLLAVVADGAGSAARAEVGARIACTRFAKAAAAYVGSAGSVADLADEVILEWFALTRAALSEVAEAEGLSVRDFACTLLGGLIGSDHAIFWQIGDGATVFSTDGEAYECGFWPQQGQYANQTHFVTDEDAGDWFTVRRLPDSVADLAVFSDGIQLLALDFGSRAPHVPFFRPRFKTVLSTVPSELEQLSSGLAAFLNSQRVNARTDDDKTLVLATRRAVTVPEVTQIETSNIEEADREGV